jgi:hypothetical protein
MMAEGRKTDRTNERKNDGRKEGRILERRKPGSQEE